MQSANRAKLKPVFETRCNDTKFLEEINRKILDLSKEEQPVETSCGEAPDQTSRAPGSCQVTGALAQRQDQDSLDILTIEGDLTFSNGMLEPKNDKVLSWPTMEVKVTPEEAPGIASAGQLGSVYS